MNANQTRICPVEIAGSFDSRIRRWVQNPRKILAPYVKEGMTVLDLGCGPGFFTIDMAQIVGKSGCVFAADLQEGMLQKIRGKVAGTDLEKRIILHKCEENKIGLSEKVDFILLFYMVHEVPDQAALFDELSGMLNPDGKIYLIEPPFHVSKKAFKKTLNIAEGAGFMIAGCPTLMINKTAVLKHSGG